VGNPPDPLVWSLAIDLTRPSILYAGGREGLVYHFDQRALCGDGALEDAEACDVGVDVAGDCCSASCTIEPAPTVCRPAASACDVAEICDGASTLCPPDTRLPDSDADGTCDAQDPCTNVARAQDFVAPPVATVRLAKLSPGERPADKRLSLSAAFDLPVARAFAELQPHLAGARVLLERADASLAIDAFLPPGSYSAATRRGWKRTGRSWTYLDRSTSPVSGVTKLVVTDRARSSSPRRVKVVVTGKNGSYEVGAGDSPVQAVVVLGSVADAAAGMCGESAYTAADCVLDRRGDRLTCKR
jgi:cysteine-rich repeat protein